MSAGNQSAENDEAASISHRDRKEGIMEDIQNLSTHTSNDLLFSLDGDYSRKPLNYEVIAQSEQEVQDIQNAPGISMGSYLVESGQAQLLTTISIYSQRGEGREQLRLLYMNAAALRIWKDMGRQPRLIGAQHRPPQTAMLALGVPFSE